MSEGRKIKKERKMVGIKDMAKGEEGRTRKMKSRSLKEGE